MSNFTRVNIGESADDEYVGKQAERALNQAPQDQWSGENMGVSVNEHGSRETSRVKMSGDDLYIDIPESQIHAFPDCRIHAAGAGAFQLSKQRSVQKLR